MTHLQSCYFCGTTGALSAYEIPAEADDAPTRITLCTRCHTKLTNVLTPILDQRVTPSASDGSEQTRLPSASPSSKATDVMTDETTTDETSTDETTIDEAATQPEVTFSATDESERADEEASTDEDGAGDGPTASEAAVTSSSEFDAETNTNADTNADAESTSDERDAADDVETDDGEEDDVEADTRENAEDEPATPGADDSDGDTDDGGASDPTPTSTEETAGDDDFPDELERVYHKLLRFLRNREFPIPRDEAETVAQSAYDLTEREASQVLQRAVDRGVLDERNGELHRS